MPRKKLLGPPVVSQKLTQFFAKRDPVEVKQEQDASHATHLPHTEEQKVLARQKLEEASVHVPEGAHAFFFFFCFK